LAITVPTMHLPCTWKEWSEFAQVAALVGGTLFLLLKALLGYFMINLSIEPSVARSRGRDRKTDDLLITLKLLKGDKEGAALNRIVIRPSRIHKDTVVEKYKEQEYKLINPTPRRRFKVSPGETVFFSYHVEAPSDATLQLEVEVFGGSGFFGVPSCYWLVSAVSFPREETRES
jgi:hypothetical protein